VVEGDGDGERDGRGDEEDGGGIGEGEKEDGDGDGYGDEAEKKREEEGERDAKCGEEMVKKLRRSQKAMPPCRRSQHTRGTLIFAWLCLGELINPAPLLVAPLFAL
jgi:hypothetical protein